MPENSMNIFNLNKKILIRNHKNIRNFSYKKGNVSLNFSLRTDIKGDLKDFQECLEAALEEVKDELKKLND